jgi:hypothetical protein
MRRQLASGREGCRLGLGPSSGRRLPDGATTNRDIRTTCARQWTGVTRVSCHRPRLSRPAATLTALGYRR